MNLNALLKAEGFDPAHVLVFRHRPQEPALCKVLPWLAAEKPAVFNAYQQTQTEQVERSMKTAKFVASFIGHEPGKAVFVGLYKIGASHPLTHDQFWEVPAYTEMKAFGLKGPDAHRPLIQWFDLTVTPFYAHWKGKLVVNWPPPERSWFRRAHQNDIAVTAVLAESIFDAAMPTWNQLVISWDELSALPTSWKSALAHWRGVYYIFDASEGKGYVGSAYGAHNILGRWLNYAASGHGGNKLLRRRDHRHFRFSILERVSPDMQDAHVIQLENTWKERLHTREPYGLNDN